MSENFNSMYWIKKRGEYAEAREAYVETKRRERRQARRGPPRSAMPAKSVGKCSRCLLDRTLYGLGDGIGPPYVCAECWTKVKGGD